MRYDQVNQQPTWKKTQSETGMFSWEDSAVPEIQCVLQSVSFLNSGKPNMTM